MLSKQQFEVAQERVRGILRSAGIVLTEEEEEKIEVADLGLGELDRLRDRSRHLGDAPAVYGLRLHTIIV